ncbi:hypothetical protein OEZ85_007264 [Tetradesmus obliquus]|uniref:Uncharacterized protein n=1 Tax=Tetradesmus obliquus TaxID=3088 RepID=A0ABY8U188_TETOB|nr:hypothetical protein OEZ85_007264 [Tetradesmus obliquus]
MQLIRHEKPLVERAGANARSSFDAEYCINLPLAARAQLSRAIITDTLQALPVPPERVSNVQEPVVLMHQVDAHSMDVRIVHSFTANFDDPLEQVYARAVAAKQEAAAAAAAAVAAASRERGGHAQQQQQQHSRRCCRQQQQGG